MAFGVFCAFWSLGVLGCSGSVGHGGRRLCFLWLIFGFSPFAWDFPLGFVFFIFTVLFISGMVIMCVSDFVHFFGERVFGWPFFGWACVFLLGFWKIHRFSPYEGVFPWVSNFVILILIYP